VMSSSETLTTLDSPVIKLGDKLNRKGWPRLYHGRVCSRGERQVPGGRIAAQQLCRLL